MKKTLRVLALMHEDLVPPESIKGLEAKEIEKFRTERDVIAGLRKLGHEVSALGVLDELAPLRNAIRDWKPDIVFNLLEEFHGQTVYDQHVVSYLELMRVPYTGCNPRGLVLARDKALSKKILHYHRIPVPRFAVAPIGRRFRRPRRLEFPLIVKSLIEEASTGIAMASVVASDEKLAERVRFIHESVRTDAIVEQYVDGRELYVGVLGNHRLTVLDLWELDLYKLPPDVPRIATSTLKWDKEFQTRHDITSGPAENVPEELERKFREISKRIYRILGLTGYARLDYRLSEDGKPYFLEANPNPEIAAVEDFARSALPLDISYEQLLARILRLGLRRAAVRS